MDIEAPGSPFLRLPPELTARILAHLSTTDLKNLERCSSAIQSVVEGKLYSKIRLPNRGGTEAKLAWVFFTYRPTLIQHVRALHLNESFNPAGLRRLFSIEFPNLTVLEVSIVSDGPPQGTWIEEDAARKLNARMKAQPRLGEITISIIYKPFDDHPFYTLQAWDAPLFNHPSLRHLALRGVDINAFADVPKDCFSLPHLESFSLEACTHSTITPLCSLTRSARNLTHIKIWPVYCRLTCPHLELSEFLNLHRDSVKALTLRFSSDQFPGADTLADNKGLQCLSQFRALRYLRVPLLCLFGTNSFTANDGECEASSTNELIPLAKSVLPPNLKCLIAEHIVCESSVPPTSGVFAIADQEMRVLHTILKHKRQLVPDLSRLWLTYAPHMTERKWLNDLARSQGVHMTQLWGEEAKVPRAEWLDAPAERLIFEEGHPSTVKEQSLVGCENADWCMRRWCVDPEPRNGLVDWLCS